MQKRKTFQERFVDLADWISEAMGTPANIGAWVFIVWAWFALFWLNPQLQYSNFLPSWFTSNAFNFPLNSITTLVELYIGFFLAAAANRSQRVLMTLLEHMEHLMAEEDGLIHDMADIQNQIHTLTKEIHNVTVKDKKE